ncbi:Abi-alpha family protein [Enterococcus sp. DIV0756]|uniref:Abi-alpha family protein n=1 Tax=Enterococcus sp. DIV0756 TaxID=2774636 RepID=UPI003F27A37F
MREDKNIKIDISPIPISKKISEELFLPPSKVIGQILGAGLNKMAMRARKYYYASEQEILDFKNDLSDKVNRIPFENRTVQNLSLTQKTLDDSQYKLTIKEVRDFFSSLIASTLDEQKSPYVHPRFSSVLQEIDYNEAFLISYLKEYKVFEMVDPFIQFDDSSLYFSDRENHTRILMKYTNKETVFYYRSTDFQFEYSNDIKFSISVLKGLEIIEPCFEESSTDPSPFTEPDNIHIQLDDRTFEYYMKEELLKIPEVQSFYDKQAKNHSFTLEYKTKSYCLTEFGRRLVRVIF